MPSNAGAIKAGSAFVELFADDNPLSRGLNVAANKVRAFGQTISSIGTKVFALGAGVALPLVALAKSAASGGTEMLLASQRTGVAVEALSALKFAAEQSGSSFEDLQIGFKKMQKVIGDAQHQDKGAIDNLHKLGMTADELRGLTPDEQLKRFADAIAGIRDPANRTAATLDIFGRGGLSLVPLLSQGSAGLNRFAQEAADLGLVMSGETATNAQQMQREFDKATRLAKGTALAFGGALVPVLTDVVRWLVPLLANFRSWVKENREVIGLVFKVAAGVMVAGLAVAFLGKVIVVAATAMSLLAGVVGLITTVLGALFSPIGLVGMALAGLGLIFQSLSGEGDRTKANLAAGWDNIRETAVTAWGGIMDAIKAGDLGLAAKIGMLGLKMVWQQIVATLQDMWAGFADFFLSVWDKVLAGWELMFRESVATIKALFVGTLDLVKDEASGILKGYLANIDRAVKEGKMTAEEGEKKKAEVREKLGGKEAGGPTRAEEIDREAAERRQQIIERVQGRKEARKQERDNNLAAAAEEFEEAKKQLNDLAGEAAEKRKAKEAKAAAAGQPGAGTQELLKPSAVAGTFSAEAARGLGGSNIPAQQLAVQQNMLGQLMQANNLTKDQLEAIKALGILG